MVVTVTVADKVMAVITATEFRHHGNGMSDTMVMEKVV